jgi:hypothetical protein
MQSEEASEELKKRLKKEQDVPGITIARGAGRY